MHQRSVVTSLLVAAVLAATCAVGPAGAAAAGPRSTGARSAVADSSPSASTAAIGERHSSCDPIVGTATTADAIRCPLPFPDDWYTRVDPGTDTGIRVALRTADMPANKAGTHIDVTEQNRNDGFSPGSALVVQLKGLDLAKTGAAPITDIGASLADDAPIVLLDATTGQRHPYWAELDANAKTAADRVLLIHPARDFIEGHRYVVGLRDLKDAKGNPLPAPTNFRLLRDETDTRVASLEARRPGIEQVFSELAEAGVVRSHLDLAWDFTIASARSLSERVLHMRDDAFVALGTKAPAFKVTSVTPSASGSVLRIVKGTFQVPRYLTGTGAPGTHLNNGSGGALPLPVRNGTWVANFDCVVPRSSLTGAGAARPTRMALYGHGLLGDAGEVEGAGAAFGTVSNTTFCATNWIGMSGEDTANVVKILGDLSSFRTLADRTQQGILDFLFLGRLMKSPKGLSTNRAFQDAQGHSLLDHQHLVFVGLSQGGIMGGATTAVAQDWNTAMLGVPGANYSLLLNRSVDFDEFGALLNPAYPSAADRQLALQLIQMLWDRGENDGYLQHFTTDPYGGTPAHKQFLLFEAFGDHQVTNISTEVMARTIGAQVRTPALRPHRATAVEPLWDIASAGRLPARGGSYLVVWDFGTPAPPIANVPNRAGQDPHGMGRGQRDVLTMASTFLSSGTLIDVCHARPCTTLTP